MNSERLEITLQQPHVHLTKRMVWKLFGEDVKLTAGVPTDMPGKFIATQTVTVTGPGGASVEMAVMGPSAPHNQVELTAALAEKLGVAAKVELSGHGTAGIVLKGPAGEAELESGVLIPQPHIHMPPEDASTLSLLDGQVITLATADGRELPGVAVRVSHLCANRIHLLAEADCPFAAEDTFHIV